MARTLVSDLDRANAWLSRELEKTGREIAEGLDRFADRCTKFSDSGFGRGFFTGVGVAAVIVWIVVVVNW